MPQRPGPRLPDPDALPCPVCGVTLREESIAPADPDRSVLDDPLLPTALARLYGVAAEADVHVFDISKEIGTGFAGAVGFDENGQMHGMVGLCDDLDDDLRLDVLAFGIAVYCADPGRILDSPGSMLGISRKRLPAASNGAGHLAWHMARLCGQSTPSATFELLSPPA